MTLHSEDSDDPSRAGRRDGEGVLTERRIPASIPDVAHSLILLERPAAVTENRVARVTQIGAYAAPSAPGGPFRVDRGWISVRIDSDAVSGAFLVDPGAGRTGALLPELRLHGPSRRSAHRCHALQDSDRLVLEGLSRVHGALSAASAAGEGRGHARRRDHDELPDQLERIDELLTRTTGHVACMPHRHIVPDALFAVLTHVRAVGLPLGIAVLSSAALHIVQDAVESVSRTGERAVVGVGDAIVEMDLPAVFHCILVRLDGPHGPTSMLELYDGGNDCIALISQFGIVGADVHERWERLAGSLPELP